MNQTQNLHLPQWEKTDRILHDDFNAAFAAIDTGIKAVNDAVTTLGTTKATAASVTALAGRVSAVESGKADSTTVSALTTRVDVFYKICVKAAALPVPHTAKALYICAAKTSKNSFV